MIWLAITKATENPAFIIVNNNQLSLPAAWNIQYLVQKTIYEYDREKETDNGRDNRLIFIKL